MIQIAESTITHLKELLSLPSWAHMLGLLHKFNIKLALGSWHFFSLQTIPINADLVSILPHAGLGCWFVQSLPEATVIEHPNKQMHHWSSGVQPQGPVPAKGWMVRLFRSPLKQSEIVQ